MFNLNAMNTDSKTFRNHLFSFQSTELALHAGLMPCVIIGRDNPILVTNDNSRIEANIICIKPNVLHRVIIRTGGAEILYLDGLKLDKTLSDFHKLEQKWNDIPDMMETNNPIHIDALRAQLSENNTLPDPAIMEIVEKLYVPSIDRMSQEELSETLGLERTQALRHFKANTGQTFRKYKIWAASVATTKAAFNGAKIGVAGLDSGFSDAAHVARTAKTIFGITPTMGIENLINIKTL